MRYARIANGLVAELVELPDELEPADAFHPDLTFVPCGADPQPGWSYDGAAFAPPSSVAPAADLKAYAAARRWAKESGGIVLNGAEIATDDTAQRKISELRRRAEAGEIPLPFGFKAVSGWIDADLATIVAIDQAVAAHVQAGYAKNREVDAAIAAGTITTFAEVDAAFA